MTVQSAPAQRHSATAAAGESSSAPEIARLRMSLALAQQEYAELLAVARAAVAASARGEPNPLFWIGDVLAAHGQLPVPGAIPQHVAAATRYTAA